jgi:hypothetical protein
MWGRCCKRRLPDDTIISLRSMSCQQSRLLFFSFCHFSFISFAFSPLKIYGGYYKGEFTQWCLSTYACE